MSRLFLLTLVLALACAYNVCDEIRDNWFRSEKVLSQIRTTYPTDDILESAADHEYRVGYYPDSGPIVSYKLLYTEADIDKICMDVMYK